MTTNLEMKTVLTENIQGRPAEELNIIHAMLQKRLSIMEANPESFADHEIALTRIRVNTAYREYTNPHCVDKTFS